MVLEHEYAHASEWSAITSITSIAENIGCARLTTEERHPLMQLGREVPLRAIGSLRKSGAFDCLQLDESSIKGWDPRTIVVHTLAPLV